MAENPSKSAGPKHTPATEKPRGRRKTAIGYVVSDKMEKTIVVELESRVQHPKYGKIIRRRTRMHVHDENNQAHVGDLVEVMACRPISKQKSWRLVRIIKQAPTGE